MIDINNIEPDDIPHAYVNQWAHNLINLIDSGVALGGYFFAEGSDQPMVDQKQIGQAWLRGRVWYRRGSYEQEITLKLLTSPSPLPC